VAIARGVVREWHSTEGWGVIDSEKTPGGCWAGFAVLQMAGYGSASAGQAVTFEFEAGWQDGYGFRALSVEMDGIEPAEFDVDPDAGSALHSELSFEVPPAPAD